MCKRALTMGESPRRAHRRQVKDRCLLRWREECQWKSRSGASVGHESLDLFAVWKFQLISPAKLTSACAGVARGRAAYDAVQDAKARGLYLCSVEHVCSQFRPSVCIVSLGTVGCKGFSRATQSRLTQSCSGPGLVTDGWTKQALQVSLDEGVSLLCRLYKAVETEGRFPSRGGLGSATAPLQQRDASILLRLKRIWAAVRSPLVRSWRLSRHWAWSWGRRRLKGGFRWEPGSVPSALMAEQACASNQANTSILFDCKNCCARIRLGRLQHATVEQQLHMRLVRVALCSTEELKACGSMELVQDGALPSMGSREMWHGSVFVAVPTRRTLSADVVRLCIHVCTVDDCHLHWLPCAGG